MKSQSACSRWHNPSYSYLRKRVSLQGNCASVTLERRLALAANDANYVIMNNYKVLS